MGREELRTYTPQGCMSSSFGNRNYTGATEAQWKATRERVFRDFPGSFIVDGADDWNAPAEARPETFTRAKDQYFPRDAAPITVLAWYHSGGSGITKSGIVVSAEDYEKLRVWYREIYGKVLEERLNVWWEGNVESVASAIWR